MTEQEILSSQNTNSSGKNKTIGLIDYGVGNLGSLSGTLKRLGYRVKAGKTADEFLDVDCLMMPGVGSMSYAIAALRRGGLDEFIINSYKSEAKRLIGICLGMQLMFEYSEEGNVDALGILPGRVCRLPDNSCHVGWDICHPTDLDGFLKQEAAFYFNHSFYVKCNRSLIRASTHVEAAGGSYMSLPAIVQSGPFVGLQFHPEKSQIVGASLLTTLIEGGATDA